MKDTQLTIVLLIMIALAVLWYRGKLQTVFNAVFGK